MLVDLTNKRVQELAKRLRRNLDIRGEHRAVLDELAKGFGFKSYAAMKAAIEAADAEPRPQDAQPDRPAGETWEQFQARLHATPGWTEFTERLAQGISPGAHGENYVGELHLGDDRGLTEPGNTSATTGASGATRDEVVAQLARSALDMLRPLNHEDLSALTPKDRLDRAVAIVQRGHWWAVPKSEADDQPRGEDVEARARKPRAADAAEIVYRVRPMGPEIDILDARGQKLETWREGNRRDDRRYFEPDALSPAGLTYPEMLLNAIRTAEDLADSEDLGEIRHDVDGEDALWREAHAARCARVVGRYRAEAEARSNGSTPTAFFAVETRREARRRIYELLTGSGIQQSLSAPHTVAIADLRGRGLALLRIVPV